VIRREGPYDAVHGHLHHLSGFALATAAAQRVPLRISHAHNDSRAIDATGSLLRKGYRDPLTAAVRRFGTHRLAVSDKAALSLHGQGWEGRVAVLPCALDFGPFARQQASLREELGIPQGAPVFGTVGRLAKEKNHAFLLDVLQALSATHPESRLLLVGDGPERAGLEARAAALGLGERVLLPGQRQDVARALATMDVFFFPSHFEGLGLAALESQAAGLPTLISTGVAEEVVVVDGLVRRLPLSAGAAAWAEAALAMLGQRGDPLDALRRIEASPYGMASHLPRLLTTYGVGEGGR
jgi:glycosyltransferase involved in cell wall biosynthesis